MTCANHPDRERYAFCQNCGKPLCRECARTVGQAVFCEPCLEARLAAANPAASTFGSGPTTGTASYQSVPGGGTAYQYTGKVEGFPYSVNGVKPPPGTPNPALAAWLGFIPGVGAMYNGQYAKGLVHLIIFAVLISLSEHNGIFGLFIAIWVCYQAFEAYHTARARREGAPVPNPFGLNDIGERFGFGRAWPTPQPPPSPTPGQPYAPPPPSSSAPFAAEAAPAPGFQDPPAPATAPTSSVVIPLPLGETRSTSWTTTPPPVAPPESQTYAAPPPPYQQPIPPLPPQRSSSLPTGALVLIALGILFLIGDTRWLGSLPFYLLLPALLIGTGVWLFIRRMTAHGTSFADDGSAAYRLRVLSAVRGSIWVVLVGVLFLLDSLHILSWGRSWPLFIIVAGVVAFLQRSTAADVRRRSAEDMPFSAAPQPSGFSNPSVTHENER